MISLVTGAAQGLGLEIARRLARRGSMLVVHYNHTAAEKASAIAAELKTLGAPRVLAIRADLRVPGQIDALFRQMAEEFGRVDVLVNNAGTIVRRPLVETDAEAWHEMLAVNVQAAGLCIAHAVRLGVTHVINVVDVAWDKAWKNHAAYVASKAALAALTRCAAVELAPAIRVNGVAPGLVSVPQGMESEYAGIEARVPAGRRGTREEVAAVVEMLLDAPAYVTGQIVAVDGGLSLR